MPISGPVSLYVVFTDTSSTAATAWLWSFGDGSVSTSQNPTHTYTTAGTYTVVLRITTSRGYAYASDTVTVASSGAVGAYTAPTWTDSGSPGSNPEIMLRLSNDGGRTWITEQIRTIGKLGEYWHRVRWNRLGCARRRVFEVSVSDPIPWRLVGAYVESQETERP